MTIEVSQPAAAEDEVERVAINGEPTCSTDAQDADRSSNTKIGAMPNLLSAFRTTESGDGKFTMTFQFRTMAAMHEADDEWQALRRSAAIAAMRPEQQWQPIATAPKDGTRVLLWIEPTRLAMPFAWNGRVWMGDDFPLNMAWATDWMPMPAPPVAACAKQGGE